MRALAICQNEVYSEFGQDRCYICHALDLGMGASPAVGLNRRIEPGRKKRQNFVTKSDKTAVF